MRWRCGAVGAHLRCQLAPFHKGMHAAAVLVDGGVGMIHWGLGEEEPPQDVVEVEEVFVETLETVIVEPAAPPPKRYWTKEYEWEGRRRDRKWLGNLYAAAQEGIHTNWDAFGHEVLPLPTLEEQEAALS